ncbi:hypothetical protein THRCLA_04355 [Thraustotheca clavata]|uniref:Uncharacterized protein n=1 Tax=Thraustotheca clavata TaxID=74557 RepID=A0A1V9ZZC2_9STRA|nr:hypothetical protein THRCLA_04355 [Thraustotheca clavata]
MTSVALTEPVPLTIEGSFSIAIANIHLNDGIDQASLDDPSSLIPVWCGIEIFTAKESNIGWWYAVNEENKRKVQTVLVQLSASTEENDTPVVSFDYLQSSKPFSLTDESLLQSLFKSFARISLYQGHTREKDSDALLGSHDIVFLPFIFGNTQNVIPMKIGIATLEAALAFDLVFFEYFKQFKAITITSLSVFNIPTEWRMVLKDGDDPQLLCDDADKNTTKVSVSLKLPIAQSTDIPETTITFDGRLAYDSSKEADTAWYIRFPMDMPMAFALSDAQIEAFIETIESDRSVALSLTRSLGADTWNATAKLPLDKFLIPGNFSSAIIEPLKRGLVPTRESLEESVTKAANNDEKKKAQLALNDYENMLTRYAGHAAVYLSANTLVELSLCFYPEALVPLPPVPLPPAKSIAEYIPPREPLQAYPKHDAIATLRKEVRKILCILLKEYDKLFELPEESDEYALSKEDRRHKLIFHLNSSGIYFEFKEKLKKALVLVIREKFPTIVNDFPTHKEPLGQVDVNTRQTKTLFYADLYSFLMEEVHVVLNHVFSTAEGERSTMDLLDATSQVSPESIKIKLKSLAQQAWESEVNTQLKKAKTCHLDRIALAEKHAALLGGHQADVWFDFALFYLRTLDLEKASNCLRDCLSCDTNHIQAIQAYGSLLCYYKDFGGADIVLKNGLALVKSTCAPQEVQARSHALLAIYYTTADRDPTGNLCLHELLQALFLVKQANSFFSPTTVCIEIAAYYESLRLDSLASIALELGAKLMKVKAVWSTEMWTTQKFVQASIQLRNQEYEGAWQSLQEAIEKDQEYADAWYLKGIVATRQIKPLDAIKSFRYALTHITHLRQEYHLPLHLHLGALYMHHQQWSEAKAIFLNSCEEASNASSWLGVGVVCIRQEDWEGAEMALAEANILDNTNAEVWGYLTLACLHSFPPRPEQADQALEQALRYELANSTLLREIGNGYVALEKLETAEGLLRRSLVHGDSSLTRKTLADVLSAQNCAETALIEYQRALARCESMDERAELLSKCVGLLETIGRFEEANEYREMALHQEEGAASEAVMLQNDKENEIETESDSIAANNKM